MYRFVEVLAVIVLFGRWPLSFFGLIDGAVPHPVAGHAVNPSVEAQWRHPCRHMVPPLDATPRSHSLRLLMGKQYLF
ncbi:hypothetical protein LMG31884_09300 [Xanthomonas hydrangeae]|nr:hypothetical protein LMG31884_09300 [Xanthomonas hydrangeae]CAD7714071.1 hypothetical protein LMG31884_09300 [Xanthomonas hydrangeae]CAD7722304.1 hypothetical protein LMG31887_09300 [Xanthomonas hydrangeae]CAD7722308.1 hypothetical protein LMG31887_09300 [Xanthomonas hydrangeae]